MVKLWDGTESVKVDSDSALTVSIADTLIVKMQKTDTITIWDGIRVFKADSTSGATITIPCAKAKMHVGQHYFINGWDNMADLADSLDFCVFTRDTTRWAHMAFTLISEKAMLLSVYEDATFDTTSGVTMTPINNNRNVNNPSVLLIKAGATVSAVGTLLYEIKVGTGDHPRRSIGGAAGFGDELILKQNSYYRFHMETVSLDNDLIWQASWPEHINK